MSPGQGAISRPQDPCFGGRTEGIVPWQVLNAARQQTKRMATVFSCIRYVLGREGRNYLELFLEPGARIEVTKRTRATTEIPSERRLAHSAALLDLGRALLDRSRQV